MDEEGALIISKWKNRNDLSKEEIEFVDAFSDDELEQERSLWQLYQTISEKINNTENATGRVLEYAFVVLYEHGKPLQPKIIRDMANKRFSRVTQRSNTFATELNRDVKSNKESYFIPIKRGVYGLKNRDEQEEETKKNKSIQDKADKKQPSKKKAKNK
jgi:hypothetical protein